MKKTLENFKIYRACPEIRHYIRQFYVAKLAMVLVAILLFPIFVLGGIFWGITFICDIAATYLFGWYVASIEYFEFRLKDKISMAHAVVPYTEIQKRIGKEDSTNQDDDIDKSTNN